MEAYNHGLYAGLLVIQAGLAEMSDKLKKGIRK